MSITFLTINQLICLQIFVILVIPIILGIFFEKFHVNWQNSVISSITKQISQEDPFERIIKTVQFNYIVNNIFMFLFIIILITLIVDFLLLLPENKISMKFVAFPYDLILYFTFFGLYSIDIILNLASSLFTVHVITSKRIISKSLKIKHLVNQYLFQNKITYLSDIYDVTLQKIDNPFVKENEIIVDFNDNSKLYMMCNNSYVIFRILQKHRKVI